ncbi:MAG: alpha/beta hydrolase [Pseudohongiella sp.]|nr:alpha/beta hydrolase [Pseudohongiella sp.]MDO9521199.1 alpha/beta hydrolase [Pseudohongiella sp.]MDP2127344.1 alpha/beta hydrolase [Pseudohongiella sp.]
MTMLRVSPYEQFNSPRKDQACVSSGRKRTGFLLALLLGIGTAMSSFFASDASAQSSTGELKVISENIEAGIKETRFDIEVDGVIVPGILWTPEGAEGTRPLVVFGHGGRQHKRVSNILRMARDLVSNEHYAVMAIDGFGHGDRAAANEAERRDRAEENMTAESMAAIDAVQKLSYVGEGPIGYWGVSMGTRFGVPLVAADSRFKAAVFGLFGLFPEGSTVPVGWGDDARSITVPLIFVYQRSDTLMTLQNGIDLFDAFGSTEKAMHINPGGHTAIPVSEREKWKPFFVSHLGKARL